MKEWMDERDVVRRMKDGGVLGEQNAALEIHVCETSCVCGTINSIGFNADKPQASRNSEQ